ADHPHSAGSLPCLCTPDEENVIEFIIYPAGQLQTLPAQKQDGKRDCRTGFVQSAATGVLICAILNTACGGLAMRRLTVVFDI
ncbi:MAG: hypothetical protein QMB70_10645, partial [Aeromonadaceae bacterium]